MNFIAPRAEPLIREIPLSRLTLAPRERPKDAARRPGRRRAQGLDRRSSTFWRILVVRPDSRMTMGDSAMPWLPAGAASRPCRRWSRTACSIPPTRCPARSGPGRCEPAELSLAENVVRVAMHPADQVVAFLQAGAGRASPVSSIAARFGLSERLVEQRLRLGNAAPELLDAYRGERDRPGGAEGIRGHHRPRAPRWRSGSRSPPSATAPVGLAGETATDRGEDSRGASAVARFVGVEAYEAAGGQVPARPVRA